MTMAYRKNKNLPVDVRKALSGAAQDIFRHAFNSIYEKTEDFSGATASAWDAVSQSFKPTSEGIYIRKTEKERTVTVIPKAGVMQKRIQESVAQFMWDKVEITEGADGVKVRRVPVILLQEGVSKNKTYYSAAALKKLHPMIEGQPLMFRNHLKPGVPKNQRDIIADWVGTIENVAIETVQLENLGGKSVTRLVASVLIHDDNLWEKCRTVPQHVGASIDILAKLSKTQQEGEDCMAVDPMAYASTDFVTFASAGGRAMAVAEAMGVELDPANTEAVKNFTEMISCQIGTACASGYVQQVEEVIEPFEIAEGSRTWDEMKKSMEIVVEEDTVDISDIIENLKAVVRDSDARSKWWDLTSGLDKAIRLIGESDKLNTDAKKKKAIHKTLDEFVTMAKVLDLVAMFASNPYETVKSPSDDGGEEENQMANEYNSVAALREAHPALMAENDKIVLAQEAEKTGVAQVAKDLKAANKTIETQTDELKALKEAQDKADLATKAAERASEIAVLVEAAKLPDYVTSKKWSAKVTGCATIEEAQAEIDSAKAIVDGATGKGSSNANPDGPTGRLSTDQTDQTQEGSKAVNEATKMDSLLAGNRVA